MLKKQQNIRFSADGASHQSTPSDSAIKMVVTMERNMLVHSVIRCPEEKFPLIFGQWQSIMLYVSTIISLSFSLFYPLFRYDQGQYLIQCQKPLTTFMFDFSSIFFITKVAGSCSEDS